MRYHRFIGKFNLQKGIIHVKDEGLISQWHSVLRLKTGDTVILCDGMGTESEAIIESLDKRSASLAIIDPHEVDREPKNKITLYASILRRENFEIVVQKATEIGISTIVPLLSERTVKTGFNQIRLQKILQEASEQSGRTVLPTLAEPMTFADALASVDPKTTVLFDGSGTPFKSKPTTANLFVGPEGGFSDREVALAKEAGYTIASLGELTLRAETAAIVVSYLGCQ